MSQHPTNVRLRTMREMTDYLRSDLYERVPASEVAGGDLDCAYWRSPLGWLVVFGLREDKTGYTGEIRSPHGVQHALTTYANIQWLEERLP